MERRLHAEREWGREQQMERRRCDEDKKRRRLSGCVLLGEDYAAVRELFYMGH